MAYEEKGILVEQVVQAERSKRTGKRLHERVFLGVRFLYLCLASFGTALAIAGTFGAEVSVPLLLLGVTLICIVYTAVWLIPYGKNIKWLILFAVLILGVFLFREKIARGMAGCYNLFAEQSNKYYGVRLSLIDAQPASGSDYLAAVLTVMLLLSGLLSLFIIHLLDGRLVALVVILPFAFSLAVGKVPSMGSVLMSTASIIGVFFLQYTGPQENLSIPTITVRMGSSALAKLRWQAAAVAGALCLLVGGVSYFTLGPALTSGYESQADLREDIRNGDLLKGMQTFWKKLTRGEWDWLPFDIIRSSGVHGGKLSNVKEIRDYDETHLYMDISGGLKAPLYIKAYVGSQYTGSGWKALDSSMNQSGLLTGMDVVSLSDQYYKLLGNLYQSGTSGIVKRDYVITLSEANSLYNYLPYGSDLGRYTAGTPFDSYLKEDTDRQIISMYYLNTQKASTLNMLAGAGASATADDSYYTFAQSVYTRIPTAGLDRFYSEYAGKSFSDIGEMVTFIRDSLAGHAVYTMIPGATPKNNDYVEYFLYDGQKGFCTQFASSAVLLFRLYGVPARYVEGYYITELDDVQGAEEIKDSRAHAWPEIYIKGAGWVPVEVTPGFLSDEDLNDRQDDQDDLTKESAQDATNPPEETPPAPTTEASQAQTEAPTAPQTTAAPQQPSAPSDGNSQTPEGKKDNPFVKVLLWILLVLAVIAAIIIAVVLRYRAKIAKQKRLMKGEPREALHYILNRSDEVLESEGMHSFRDADSAEEYNGLVSDSLLLRWKLLDQELTFSRHGFSEETRDEMRREYEDLAQKVIDGKKLPGKLWARYGKCYG